VPRVEWRWKIMERKTQATAGKIYTTFTWKNQRLLKKKNSRLEIDVIVMTNQPQWWKSFLSNETAIHTGARSSFFPAGDDVRGLHLIYVFFSWESRKCFLIDTIQWDILLNAATEFNFRNCCQNISLAKWKVAGLRGWWFVQGGKFEHLLKRLINVII